MPGRQTQSRPQRSSNTATEEMYVIIYAVGSSPCLIEIINARVRLLDVTLALLCRPTVSGALRAGQRLVHDST